MSTPGKTPKGKLPLMIVVSTMIGAMGMILGAFLGFAGVQYGFQWPGIFKSVVCGILMLLTVFYGGQRGVKDIASVNRLRPEQKEVGFAHAGVIMLFVVLLTAFAMWIFVGWPVSSVLGPLG